MASSPEAAWADHPLLFVGEEIRLQPSNVDFSEWQRAELMDLAEKSVQFPASFDREVWPRAEDVESRPPQKRVRNLLELEPMQLCDSSDRTKSRIAVALVSFHGPITQAMRRAEGGLGAQTSAPGWQFMGFDVLDSGLAMSGLLNFGQIVVPIAKKVLADRSEKLNRFFLWPTIETADDYRARVGRVIAEHAPFEIIALFGCGV